jgi:hypothetical protein
MLDTYEYQTEQYEELLEKYSKLLHPNHYQVCQNIVITVPWRPAKSNHFFPEPAVIDKYD